MIIVQIIGGLGNQMFQYAYAKVLEQKGHEVKIDISAFDMYKLHGGYQLDRYNISLQASLVEENERYYSTMLLSKILQKLKISNSKLIKEKSLLFDNNLLDVKDENYIIGYFQCEKYFKNIRNILLKEFIIKQEPSNYTKEIKQKIKKSQNSCSLHIRRGDFLNEKNSNIHGVCTLEYYENAIKYLEKEEKAINYFIFSDDIEWVKDNLKLENATYIESEEKRIPHEDIYLMSLCMHNIIANSSFSWWGAWLNENINKIVIGPKTWFIDKNINNQSNDILCENWIRI